MIIAYCDKCTFRIPEEDLKSGYAVEVEPGRYLCGKCKGEKKTPAEAAAGVRPSETVLTPNLAPRRQSSATPQSRGRASARAPETPGREPGKWSGTKIGLIAGLAAVLAGAIAYGLSAGRGDAPSQAAGKPQNAASGATPPTGPALQTPQSPHSPPQPAAAVPALPAAEEKPAPDTGKVDEERRKYAHQLLEEVRENFKEHPEDPWDYRDKLSQIAVRHSSTPAGAEAEKLANELKLPPSAIKDGGFESGKFGAWEDGGKPKTKIVSKGARTGKHCARAGAEGGFGQRVKLKPNTAYVLWAWVRVDDNDKLGLGVKEYSGPDTFKEYASKEYLKITQTFKTGAADTGALVYVSKKKGWKDGYVDDVFLVEQDAMPGKKK